MKLLTKRGLIERVAQHWKAQSVTLGSWASPKKREIYQRLVALPDNASEQQVIDIVGNDSWTRNSCDECKKDAFVAVQVGEGPDYKSSTAQICLDCLKKALEMIKGAD